MLYGVFPTDWMGKQTPKKLGDINTVLFLPDEPSEGLGIKLWVTDGFPARKTISPRV